MKLLMGLTFVGMIASLYMAFIYAPTEMVMGNIQRIFYFHMGAVWVATIAFTVVFIASIQYLRKQTRFWDIMAYSSAEIGVLFTTLTIITGSIWAKPVWGTWWTWDPQLTTTFILWILYIVYLILRSSAGSDVKKAKFAAVFGIIAFLDLPLVYASARLMRGISHVVFWILLFLYIFNLVGKNKKLQKELEALKNSINKTKEEKLTWQKQGVN